jgi:hypothetical protein
MPGGKLQTTTGIASGRRLVRLNHGVRLTLDGGLSLAGTGNLADNIRGIYIDSNSVFTMNGGKISGHFAYNPSSSTNALGAGVFIYGGGTFIMNGGEIYGNTAERGGGVCVSINGTFIMKGGEIYGNIATGSASGGAGLYILVEDSTKYGSFAKTGGTIYGYSSSEPVKSNKVTNSGNIVTNMGHAVYVTNSYCKDSTVGPGIRLFYRDPAEGTSGW